jgi:hypothetical protein
MSEFRTELQRVINRCSKENGSDTPDFILARFLEECLEAFDNAVAVRTEWHDSQNVPDPSWERDWI